MGCCGIKGDKEGEEDDKRARKQNKEIEKQIQKDKQVILDLVPMLISKGWGQSAKLGKHGAIWGKLDTALQAYALNPCTKFPPNPTSRKVNT